MNLLIGHDESLPNIAGKAFTTIATGSSMAAAATIQSGATGPFYQEDYPSTNVNLTYSGVVSGYSKLGFDASKCSKTYGRDTYVRPRNITIRHWSRTA